MKRDRLMELAGIRLTEGVEGLSSQIFKMAEKAAYDESSNGKRSVTGDQIMSIAKGIMSEITVEVTDLIKQKHMGK